MAHRLRELVQAPPSETPAERLLIALDLHETGLDLVRARLRRDDPEAPDATIEARLEAWLRDVPPPRGSRLLGAILTPLGCDLSSIATRLHTSGASWALVDGLAVSARCEPRFARDIDLAVAARCDEDAERLVRQLVAQGLGVETLVEQDATGRLAMVRLRQRSTAVDLLFASSGVEADLAARANHLEVLPGVVVPVAQLGDLVATKLLSDEPSRPQDRLDLVAMRREAAARDLARARNRRGHCGARLRSGA